MVQQSAQRLTGEQLLNAVSRLAHCTCEQKAKQCGYVVLADDGTELPDRIEFMAAVLEARGIPVGPSVMDSCSASIQTTTIVKVQADGCLDIHALCLQSIGLEPGDEVQVSYNGQYLYLSAVDTTKTDYLTLAVGQQ